MVSNCAKLALRAGAAIFASLALVFGAYADVDRAADSTTGAGGGSQILGNGGNPLAGDCPASSGAGGDWTLTQSQDLVTDSENQIACGVAAE